MSSRNTNDSNSNSVPLRIVSWNVNGLRSLTRFLCKELCGPLGGCQKASQVWDREMADSSETAASAGDRHQRSDRSSTSTPNMKSSYSSSSASLGSDSSGSSTQQPATSSSSSHHPLLRPLPPHPRETFSAHAASTLSSLLLSNITSASGERKQFSACRALRYCLETVLRADVVCLQETKVGSRYAELDDDLVNLGPGWESFWSISHAQPGYSGCVTYARRGLVHSAAERLSCPDKVRLSSPEGGSNTTSSFDDRDEGRCVVTDIGGGALTLFNVYVPNGGRGPELVDFKMQFCRELERRCSQPGHVESLGTAVDVDNIKTTSAVTSLGVILGDLNTCHRELDIHQPVNRSGFLPDERAWMDDLFGKIPLCRDDEVSSNSKGQQAIVDDQDAAEPSSRIPPAPYLDTFRFINGHKPNSYSWWSLKTQQREVNKGWRLDYIAIQSFVPRSWLLDAGIATGVHGSDHCPVFLDVAVPVNRLGVRKVTPPLSNIAMRPSRQSSIAGFFSKSKPVAAQASPVVAPNKDSNALPKFAAPATTASRVIPASNCIDLVDDASDNSNTGSSKREATSAFSEAQSAPLQKKQRLSFRTTADATPPGEASSRTTEVSTTTTSTLSSTTRGSLHAFFQPKRE